jgi:short-subunit dehydrogenase
MKDKHSLQFESLRAYGSTALVTGASSGIGACFAKTIAASGYSTVIVVARRMSRLQDLQAEIEGMHGGCRCIPITLDLSKPDAREQLAKEVAKHKVSIDVVVNNAGFGLLGALEDIEPARCREMVDLNCGAVLDIARMFLPAMKERKRGAMIITSSVVGAISTPWFGVYAATKSFNLYLGEALYAECKGSGVSVLTVLPGLTNTEFQAGMGEREYSVSYRSPEQVVATACRALGRKAIVVDGLLYKLLVHGTRFLPRCVMLFLSRRTMRRQVAGVLGD